MPFAFLLFAVLSLGAPLDAATFPVTSCGTLVTEPGTAVLQADLVCTSSDPYGVKLDRRGTLLMNGHSISGALYQGVLCDEGCRIIGPGDISGSDCGVTLSTGTSRLEDLDIHDNTRCGISVSEAGLKLKSVTVINNGQDGIHMDGGYTHRLKGSSVTVSGNGGRGIYAPAGGPGVRSFSFNDLTATGNAGIGISAERAALKNSVVTGNDAAGQGIDLETTTAPRLRATTCGRSSDGAGGNWGVCTND